MSLKSMLPKHRHSDTESVDVFSNLQSEVDRVFDEFKDFSPFSALPSARRRMEFTNPVPKIDFSESENSVEIEAELPGVERKNVDITLDGQLLKIEGKKDTEKKTEKKNYRLLERSEGSFQRVIPLGFEANPDQIQANFTDGVLTVTVTKPPEAVSKVKKITVTDNKEK